MDVHRTPHGSRLRLYALFYSAPPKNLRSHSRMLSWPCKQTSGLSLRSAPRSTEIPCHTNGSPYLSEPRNCSAHAVLRPLRGAGTRASRDYGSLVACRASFVGRWIASRRGYEGIPRRRVDLRSARRARAHRAADGVLRGGAVGVVAEPLLSGYFLRAEGGSPLTPTPLPQRGEGLLFVADRANAGRAPVGSRYRSRGFAAFADGALAAAVALPSGWHALAVRFVERGTGRATALFPVGIVRVG